MDKINTALELFSKTNEINSMLGYFYKFYKISTCCTSNEIHTLAENYLNKVSFCDDAVIKLKRLDDWEEELFKENELFKNHNINFISSEDHWFRKTSCEINLGELNPKKYLINLLKEYFSSSDIEVFYMDINSNKYYACQWEDYLFYDKTLLNLYWLTFQAHD